MVNKKPLSSLTNYEREKEIKRRQDEERERIDVLGQESDRKAIPWVKREVATQERKDRDYFYAITDLLKRHQSKKLAYFRILTQVFLHFLSEEAIPKKYFLDIEANDIGLKVEIKNTKFYGAFKVCGLPSYDFRACQVLALKVAGTVAHLEGARQTTNQGIGLPDEVDLKTYG